MEEQFLVTDIQRFSVNDGPGIRTTVFLKGCPLNCLWCHNPECKNPHDEIYQHVDKCIRCGECIRACPEGAITFPRNQEKAYSGPRYHLDSGGEVSGQASSSIEDIRPPRIDRAQCKGCMKCVETCKYGAITRVSKTMTVGDVMEEVKADEIFYETSGGGLTVSGGDPLLLPDVTLALLKASKGIGIHTALETSGFFQWNIIESIAEHVDLFLIDIKSLDDEKHKKWTGVSNRLILENVRKMSKKGMNMRLRLPVVHDVNFWDLGYVRSVVELARELGQCVSGIDILPYHNFAEKKYEQLGVEYFFKGFSNLYKEDVQDYEAILKESGFCDVTIGGIQGVNGAGNDLP